MKEFTCLQLIFWLEHSIIRTTFAHYNNRYLLPKLCKVIIFSTYLVGSRRLISRCHRRRYQNSFLSVSTFSLKKYLFSTRNFLTRKVDVKKYGNQLFLSKFQYRKLLSHINLVFIQSA